MPFFQFLAKPKLGGDQLISTFQHKIDVDIEEKFHLFKQENDKKRTNFVVSFRTNAETRKKKFYKET